MGEIETVIKNYLVAVFIAAIINITKTNVFMLVRSFVAIVLNSAMKKHFVKCTIDNVADVLEEFYALCTIKSFFFPF